MAAIDGGGSHSCALMAGGGVKCWGDNFSGQLGMGRTTDRTNPVNVSRNGERGGGHRQRLFSDLYADGGRRGQVLGKQP